MREKTMKYIKRDIEDTIKMLTGEYVCILCMRPELSAIDAKHLIVPIWLI